MREVYENPNAYSFKADNALNIANSMTTDQVAKIIDREIGRIKVR
jgi:hypothetical protein